MTLNKFKSSFRVEARVQFQLELRTWFFHKEEILENTDSREKLSEKGKDQLYCPTFGTRPESNPGHIGNCRNVRGLGKSMVVFRLFEKLRYSNERSTKFESLCQE